MLYISESSGNRCAQSYWTLRVRIHTLFLCQFIMMKYILIIWMTILQVSSNSVDQRSVDNCKMFDHMLRLQEAVLKLSTKLEHTESEMATLNRKLTGRLDKITEELAIKSSQINNLTTLAEGTAGSISFEVRQKVNPLTVGAGAVLKFDDVTLNEGGAYNPNSGIFIAPVTGTYIFWANILSGDTGDFAVTLNLDNKKLLNGYTSRVVNHGSALLMYILKVRKGQHMWFAISKSGKINGYNHSSYGGTLITTT